MDNLAVIVNRWLSTNTDHWFVKGESPQGWFVCTRVMKEGRLGEEQLLLKSFQVMNDKLIFLGNDQSIPKNLNAADPDFFPKLKYVIDLIEAMERN